MANIIDFGMPLPTPDDLPRTHNREVLDRIKAMAEAADTPEARLLNELRGMEETLLANHRRYARLWEEADRIGFVPPVRTASQIVAEADGFTQNAPPLPPSLSFLSNTRTETQPAPSAAWAAGGSHGKRILLCTNIRL